MNTSSTGNKDTFISLTLLQLDFGGCETNAASAIEVNPKFYQYINLYPSTKHMHV